MPTPQKYITVLIPVFPYFFSELYIFLHIPNVVAAIFNSPFFASCKVLGISEPRKTIFSFSSTVSSTDRFHGSSECISHLSAFIFIPSLPQECSQWDVDKCRCSNTAAIRVVYSAYFRSIRRLLKVTCSFKHLISCIAKSRNTLNNVGDSKQTCPTPTTTACLISI